MTQPSICGVGKKTHSVSIGTYLLHLEPLGTVTLRNLSAHLKKKKKSESKSTQSCIFNISSAHLFIDLISIQCFPVWISTGVKRAHKLIVVNEAVVVHVKDARHCVHLQRVCGEFCKKCQHRCITKEANFSCVSFTGVLTSTNVGRFNLTGGKDVVHKLLVGDPTILVTVDASEHI